MDFIRYIKISENEDFDNIITLDDECLSNINQKRQLIAQMQESFMLYQSFLFNVYNLQKCVNIYSSGNISLTEHCPTEIQDTSIVINALISNLFSSAKTLTEKITSVIQKHFSNNDPFMVQRSQIFDTSPAYRLSQEFRNMCQHGFCVVSKQNDKYGFDLYQLQNIQGYKCSKKFKMTVNDLINKLSDKSPSPMYSLSALVSEFTTDVIRLYIVFLNRLHPTIENINTALNTIKSQKPELLTHNDPRLSGFLLIADGSTLHAVSLKDSPLTALDYYLDDSQKQLLLFEQAEENIKKAFIRL